MSTKIYYGTCLPSMDFQEMYTWLRAFSERAKKKQIDLVTKQLATMAAHTIDWAAWKGRRLRKSTYWRVAEVLRKLAEIETPGHKPFYLELCVAPTAERILVIPFGGKPMMNFWRAQPEVSEYGYWDNTDPPRNISYRRFQARRPQWEQVIGYEPTIETMFTWQATHTHEILPDPRKIVARFPIFRTRVRGLAMNSLLEERQAEGLGANMSWLASPDGQQAVAERIKLVEPKLRRVLTREDLTKGRL